MPDLLGLLSYGTFFLVFATIYGLVVLGLNLQWGFTGLFNVGVAGFVAIGAYTSALLTAPDYPDQIGGLGLPIPLGWLGAMATSGLAAFIVGVAALRLRHDYLAITTFGIAVTLQLVALNAQGLTGGPFGLQFIPKPFADVIADNLAWNLAYLAMAATLLGLSYVALERLVRSPWGRVLRAIREDETAAESLGKRRLPVSPPGLCDRVHAHGAWRSALRALCRLHRSGGFSADPHVSALDDADRGRFGQQSRRHPWSRRSVGLMDPRPGMCFVNSSRPSTRPGQQPCKLFSLGCF